MLARLRRVRCKLGASIIVSSDQRNLVFSICPEVADPQSAIGRLENYPCRSPGPAQGRARCRAGPPRPGSGRGQGARRGRGQGREGKGRAKGTGRWPGSVQFSSGQVKSSQVKSSQVRSGQVRSGQVRSSQVKSGQVSHSSASLHGMSFGACSPGKALPWQCLPGMSQFPGTHGLVRGIPCAGSTFPGAGLPYRLWHCWGGHCWARLPAAGPPVAELAQLSADPVVNRTVPMGLALFTDSIVLVSR